MSTNNNPASFSELIANIILEAQKWGPALMNPETQEGQEAKLRLQRARVELQAVLDHMQS